MQSILCPFIICMHNLCKIQAFTVRAIIKKPKQWSFLLFSCFFFFQRDLSNQQEALVPTALGALLPILSIIVVVPVKIGCRSIFPLVVCTLNLGLKMDNYQILENHRYVAIKLEIMVCFDGKGFHIQVICCSEDTASFVSKKFWWSGKNIPCNSSIVGVVQHTMCSVVQEFISNFNIWKRWQQRQIMFSQLPLCSVQQVGWCFSVST